MFTGLPVVRRALAAVLIVASVGASGCLHDDDDRHQRLVVRDLESGATENVSASDRTVSHARWMPGSSALLVFEGETPGGYFVSLRDAESGKARWEIEGQHDSGRPVAAAPGPGGNEVAVLRDSFGSGERRALIEFVDVAEGKVLRTTEEWVTILSSGATPDAASIAWTPSGRIAVVSHHGGGFNDLLWFDAGSGEDEIWKPTEPSEIWALGNAKNNRVVVFATRQPGPGSLTLHEGESVRELPIPTEGNFAVDFSPDGERLVVASGEKVFVYDFAAGSLLEIASAQTQGISWGSNGRIAMAWGNEVFSIAEDGTDRQKLVTIGAGQTLRNPIWSPDGNKLAYVVAPRYRD